MLQSLIGTVEAEVELRRSQQQRLRTRRAERRLGELRQQLSALEDGYRPAARRRPRSSRALVRLVGAVWVVGAVLLAAEVAVDGAHSTRVVVGDVVMLALSLIWFLLAVARVPLSEQRAEEPAPHA